MNDVASPDVPVSAFPPKPSSWISPILIALAYLAFSVIAPHIPADSAGAVLFSTMISLGLIIWFTAQFARTFHRPRMLIWNALLSAGLALPLRIMLELRHPVVPWIYLLHIPGFAYPGPTFSAFSGVLFVWFAASLGGLLSFILRSANMIPPIAAVLALVDVWTVLLGGPVQKIIHSANPTAQAVTKVMTVPLPAPTPVGATPILPTTYVGFADFLFIAFFVAAICRFVPRPGVYVRMVVTLTSALCAYMLLVFFTGWALPALLPMAVVMMGLHWRYFRYSRSEAFALLYAALLIALLVAGYWYLRTQNASRIPVRRSPIVWSLYTSLGARKAMPDQRYRRSVHAPTAS